MMEVLREALRRAKGAGPQALATVVRTSGSTPRHAGAKMVVGADGSSFGTIGGGRVELEVARAGAEVAGGAPSRIVRHHLVRDLAMCCGGSMEVLVQPVSPSARAIEGAVELAERRRPGLLVSRLDGTAMALEESAAHTGRRPSLEGDRFAEPILPPDRVVIFGLGHVARALGPVLAGLGFEIAVCDDDETGALAAAPPWAQRTVDSFDLPDVERAIGPIGFADYVIITTRDHAIDQRILEQALAHPALDELAYLGLIGSRGKIGRFKKRLVAKGVATEERWSRLRAPIGLDIAAETPAEIAISVAAELIRLRNAAPADR
ncbi:MAG TPA: xanthine dehydrogenase accessory protein XdhC [Kofleriaceae bacterium]|jgi:xanthine dehydrogenase accessory factor